MRWERLLLCLLIPFLLQGNEELSFFEEEDPAVFHHVNVITGHLYLSFRDAVAQGALSIPVVRTYSSTPT